MTDEFKKMVAIISQTLLWIIAIFLFIPTLGWSCKLWLKYIHYLVDKKWMSYSELEKIFE
jgi:hypothetical protein